jgi:glyoxylase-like metal-dependent hydrolase (beta-lactamase superfamily II)
MWDEVGPDCFRRRYESFDLNIGAVRGADGLLLIDTRCHAVEARELLDDLRVFGPQPVRRIVNTHWHFDHCWGNATIRAASPGAEIYGHERLARWARDFFAEEKESVKQRWPELAADEIDAVELVLPDHEVHDVLTIDLGDREVVLRHPGRGHTDNDLVIVVPDATVVFAGDIVEESAPPAYGDDCFPLEWPATNVELLEWIAPDATVVPGHGDVIDRAFVAHQLEDVARVATTIRVLHAAGVPLADALPAAEWPFPPERLGAAVERGYAQLESVHKQERDPGR